MILGNFNVRSFLHSLKEKTQCGTLLFRGHELDVCFHPCKGELLSWIKPQVYLAYHPSSTNSKHYLFQSSSSRKMHLTSI